MTGNGRDGLWLVTGSYATLSYSAFSENGNQNIYSAGERFDAVEPQLQAGFLSQHDDQ